MSSDVLASGRLTYCNANRILHLAPAHSSSTILYDKKIRYKQSQKKKWFDCGRTYRLLKAATFPLLLYVVPFLFARERALVGGFPRDSFRGFPWTASPTLITEVSKEFRKVSSVRRRCVTTELTTPEPTLYVDRRITLKSFTRMGLMISTSRCLKLKHTFIGSTYAHTYMYTYSTILHILINDSYIHVNFILCLPLTGNRSK